MVNVLVLGGAGFVGRYACSALQAAGANVEIGSRFPERTNYRLPPQLQACPKREIRLERLLQAEAWQGPLEGVDVVLNCVGILRQRGDETYAKVHTQAPTALAQTCAASGRRLVQVSALGLSDRAKSRFLTSKLAGERSISAAGGDWVLARPSLLDGPDGFGARWLRGISKLPFFVAPANAKGLIAALDVTDLGEALAVLCLRSPEELRLTQSREFDLGGTQALAFADYIAALRRTHSNTPARCITIPGWLARAGAHLCDLLHITPFSFGHWELLSRDNLPNPNRLPELLGREPLAVGKVTP